MVLRRVEMERRRKKIKTMKTFGYLLILIALFAARVEPVEQSSVATAPLKPCNGYTVIEAGKGLDCNGDTINLIKKHGFFEVAARYDERETNTMVN